MTSARWAGVAVALLLVAAVAATVLLRSDAKPALGPRPPEKRPPLMLLTTLPIVFPETLTLNAPPSPVLKALQSRYRIVPISTADSASLRGRELLLMAQPQAQPPEALVDLDRWVRGGGHVLLLADPELEWPSERPFGDILRPPPSFADTGLLAHWGLRLEAPDRAGPATIEADSIQARTRSPGRLAATGRNCALTGGGAVARCRLGSGLVMVIPDADFLAPGESEATRGRNLDLLLLELDRLER